jgi:lipopolysaccharide export system protein LptA
VEPIRILHADRLPLDRGQETLELEGHVRVAKGTTTLSGEHLKWTRSRQLLELRGDVVVQDKDFRLGSEHLLYDLAADAATAWGRPRLAQEAGQGAQEIVMRAVQLRLFPKEGRVEALEDVELEQLARTGSESTLEMRVTCRVGEILSRGRRNVFKGDVRVETPDIGATAGRMLYEQESRRVYLLDGARVWNYDSGGKKLDELRGDKVIYFLDEARTISLGGVRASVHPEGRPGQRTLLRSRRALGE